MTVPNLPAGEIGSVRISRSETKLAFQLNGDRSPNNLYVYEFGGKAPVRLTDTLAKEVDPNDLVEAEVVRFKSFDGMTIPNIFYKPHQATAQAKAPALVWVHGGPGGQTRRSYSAHQYLVNHGYAVWDQQPGGSGYGKAFFVADDKKRPRAAGGLHLGEKYLQGLPEWTPTASASSGGATAAT